MSQKTNPSTSSGQAHESGFRPSHFSALEACIHHEQRPAGPAAEKGLEFHEYISENLKALQLTGTISGAPSWASDLVISYIKQGWNILCVEKEVQLAAPDGNTMTSGTIDLVMIKDKDFLIIDWKTGETPRDYSAQLAGYIMALEELHLEAESTTALVAMVDLQQTIDVTQSYRDSAFRTFNLYEKWKNKKNEHYRINEYCDWCALRGDCPEWRAAGDRTLAHLRELTSPPGPVSEAKIDSLKTAPLDLEKFLISYERLKTLVEEEWNLKAALKSHMETGYKADNFSLVHIKDKEITEEIIDPEQYLLHVVKPLGAMKAAQAVKVDPVKAREIWAATMNGKPFPVKSRTLTTTKSGYSYIRAKK